VSAGEASAAVVSPQRGQATPEWPAGRHLSLAPGRVAAEGPVLASSDALLRSLARYPGHGGDAAVAVRQEDQRTDEDAVRRLAVRERDQGAVEARFGSRLVRHAERSAFGWPTVRSLVREPGRARFLERRASQAAIGHANPASNRGFLRPAERGASQTAADSPLVRPYERWAFQGNEP
jgi:hypothetical protein